MLDITAANKKTCVLLTLILFLGLMVRLPGAFWGFDLSSGSSFISYHGDERTQAEICQEFLSGRINQGESHPKAFGFQIFLTTFVLKPFIQTDMPGLIVTGRVLSLIYAVLSIFLLYFLSYEVFKCKRTALFSSLLLALAGLHVTESHYAIVDVGATFWVYLTMYLSLLFSRYHKISYLILAVISAGLAIAFKMSFFVGIILIYVLIKKKSKFFDLLLCLAGMLIVIIVANGGHYTLNNFKLTVTDLIYKENVHPYGHRHRLCNLPFYFLGVVPSLGLVNFIFLITGTLSLRKKLSHWKLNNDIFFILILPLMVYGVSICFLGVSPLRYILPLVPGLVMLAAYGVNKIKESLSNFKFCLVIIIGIIYQLVYVVGTEYYYFFETRQDARAWIIENVPPGRSIHLGPYAVIPDLNKYKLRDDYNSDYVVLHEKGYERYLPNKKYFLKTYPVWEDIYHGDFQDFSEIQKIFMGRSDLVLVKSFPTRYITPESILFKRLFGTDSFVGDTLIFQRK